MERVTFKGDMKLHQLFLLVAVGYFPICFAGKASDEYIGCYADHPKRAMPVMLDNIKTNLAEECRKQAAFNGYKVYGIQNQVECWSGPNAHNTYAKYGEISNCKNGLGGSWSNSVYRVSCDGASLAGLLNELIANASSIDDIDVGAFVSAASKLLNRSSSEWKKNPKLADNFLSASEGLLTLGMDATKSLAATNALMVFSITKVDTSAANSLVFPNYNDPTFSQKQSSSSFVVPTINNIMSANIGGYVYSNLHERLSTSLNVSDPMFRSGYGQSVVSKVLSCQVNPPILFGVNTNETVIITLEHLMLLPEDAVSVCGFWKHAESENSSGIWSTEGCNVVSSNATHTRCNCTHLTNFAILMQYKNVELEDDHIRALTILTNIGCSLSLVAIFITVAIYFVFGLYRAPNFHIHINLCFAIAMAQISLLFSSQARVDKDTCVVMSLFLHYFCLCVFTWMLVEGLQIYKKVVSIFSSSLNLVHCHLLGWGIPILIVFITYGSRNDHYTDDESCWLSPDYGIRWSFIGPVLAIIMVNVFVTVITLRKRLQLRSVVTKEIGFKIRTSLRALFVLLPIFGITWLVGVFGFTSDAVAAMYIFVILNASQGLLIFIFHCVLNAEVRKVVFQGRRARIHTRNGTLSGSNKTPSEKLPSKNSDCSTNRGEVCRQLSGQSGRSTPIVVTEQEIKDDLQLTDNSATGSRSTHLVT